MPLTYVAAWAKAFALTVAIELPIATWLLARAEPDLRRRLGLVFFANLASHPAVWFVFPALFPSYPAMIVAAESWALLSEAVFFALAFPAAPWRRALGASAVANAASFSAGLILRALTGWV